MDSLIWQNPEDDLRFGGFYGNAYGATLPKVSVLGGLVWSLSLLPWRRNVYMLRNVRAYVGDEMYEILACFIVL